MRMIPLAALAALLAALPTPAAAQRDRDRDRDGYRSRVDTTYAFERGGTVDLTQISGDITVRAWDRGEVRVAAYSERGSLRFDASPSRVVLNVRPESGRMGDTRYDLTVPVGTRVIARSTSGDIEVTGVRGEVEVTNTSGNVTIQDATRVSAVTISGNAEVARVDGNVKVSVVSGDVAVSRVTGDVIAESVSGEVTIADVRSRFVRAASTSGEVEFQGSIDASGRYEFHSHSGSVRLLLPSDVSATLTLETFSGEIESDFPMTMQPRDRATQRPQRLEFTIGGGGARISAQSFSGEILIRRSSGRDR